MKDFSWYLLGSVFPMIIGFIKIPIFTRHFSTVDYGYYGLVVATYTYLSMFLFSWLASCIWRFYQKYKQENRLQIFYSNIIFLFLLSVFVLTLLSTAWFLISDNEMTRLLILFGYFQLVLNQFILLYMIMIRMEGRAQYFNLFQTVRVIISFLLLFILVFRYEMNISALLLSLAAIDVIMLIYLLLRNPLKAKVNFKLINKPDLRIILQYGVVGLLANVGLLVILSSDRYIIALFEEIRFVGIYDQTYKIAQVSVAALAAVYMNTINPTYLYALEKDFSNSVKMLTQYVTAFIMIGLPIVVYASFFSKEIALIMLGPEFREGFFLLPYIFLGTFFFHLSQFWENRLKFSDKLKSLSLSIIFTMLLNLALNIIMIRAYGYQWAAISTLISYFILFLFYYLSDSSAYFKNRNHILLLLKVFLILFLQYAIHVTMRKLLAFNLFYSFLEAIIWVLIYYLIFRKKIHSLSLPLMA